ncbi:hypothetical protein J1614_005604 [Plenodomus biglobosus]|nr:hypothetical protein J1614_005604 [Plenodomus biglobosus]
MYCQTPPFLRISYFHPHSLRAVHSFLSTIALPGQSIGTRRYLIYIAKRRCHSLLRLAFTSTFCRTPHSLPPYLFPGPLYRPFSAPADTTSQSIFNEPINNMILRELESNNMGRALGSCSSSVENRGITSSATPISVPNHQHHWLLSISLSTGALSSPPQPPGTRLF